MKGEKSGRFFYLRYKMLLVLALGLVIAVGLFFAVSYAGCLLVEYYYMDEVSVEQRQRAYEKSLEDYVTDNQLSIRDVSGISGWVKANPDVYLMLYDGDIVVYESGWLDEDSGAYSVYMESTDENVFGDETASSEEGDLVEEGDSVAKSAADTDAAERNRAAVGSGENFDARNGEAAGEDSAVQNGTDSGTAAENAGSLDSPEASESEAGSVYSVEVPMHDIEFSDGVFTASIVEFSEMKWYDIVEFFSWGALIITILVILLLYNRRMTNRVVRLSKEVSTVANGAWGADISHRGRDEISQLAVDVKNMRNTMLERMESEKAAWNVNSELITSMSHDIRTPLTALMGYLDLLDSEDYKSEEELRRYIRNCKQKAIQLKELSDKMFQYFLVFGRESLEMETETYDTEILLQQLIGEQLFDLSNMEFVIRTDFHKKKSRLTADIHYLKRLFDNLFSNVKKYAAPHGDVLLRTRIVGEELLICIGNDIRDDDVLVESTNIGLKTCQKIVEQMNGRFRVNRSEKYFEVRIVLPVEPDE